MGNKAKVTSIKQGEVKTICLNSSFSPLKLQAHGICINPDKNGNFNLEAGSNIILTSIENGVKIESSGVGGVGGEALPLINVSDGRTLTINTKHVVFPWDDENSVLYLPDVKEYPLGTIIEIKSIGKGTYKIQQKDKQCIYHYNENTTLGSKGYLQSRDNGTGNWIQLVITNDTIKTQDWYVFGYNGSFDCY